MTPALRMAAWLGLSLLLWEAVVHVVPPLLRGVAFVVVTLLVAGGML